MRIYESLVKKVLYPLWMVQQGDRGIIKYLNYFDPVDHWQAAQLEQWQTQWLKNILIHAYEHTRYFKEVFDQLKFNPLQIKRVQDISLLPILEKQTIRERFADLTANNINPADLLDASTGGSTGIPLKFLRDRECVYLRKGQELYFDRKNGYDLGKRMAYFVSGSHYTGAIASLKAKLKNLTCERMLSFDPHDITDDYMQEFAEKFIQFRPEIVKCFPNALIPFAEFVQKNRIELPAVKAITCTGETLYDDQKKLLEHVFKGKVYEKVGTRESGVIAAECRQRDGLHVFSAGVLFEILRADGTPAAAGEIGRVILTDFFNKGMPLIRYDIGDMAVAAPGQTCPCGSPLPKIARYLGRTRDIVIDAKGNPRPGYLFVEVIRSMNYKSQFQIIQEENSLLHTKIIKQENEEIDLVKIKAEFEKIVGSSFRITFEFVREIPRDPSGKYGYVISKIKKPLKLQNV